MKEKIKIFDTTLRDGEQSPGASLSIIEKVEIAKQLSKLNVDIIEAGFPISSKVQFESVERIVDSIEGPTVAALARAIDLDIKVAYKALRYSNKSRIHTFIGTSDIHIIGKFSNKKYGSNLNEKRKSVLKMAVDAVRLAKTYSKDVEFSPEDAGRTDIEFLCDIIEAVIEAGAQTINIPDTTGYTMPTELGEKIRIIHNIVPNIDDCIISVHCHDDLGLAVANSLSAISNGARQVECTINGIGERAGNASLEEIVMALEVRKDLWNFHTDVKTEEIYNTSKMVSNFTGIIVQPNKAIIGDNAFSHESGIHQDGVLKNRNTYEIMTPETIGITNNKIVLGRHSGRHGLYARLTSLGYELSESRMDKIYPLFIELADKKKEIFDEDLRCLMGDSISGKNKFYNLEYLSVNVGTSIVPTATVKICADGKNFEESAIGDGPVSATFRSIKKALKLANNIVLDHYQVRSITSGKDALGEVTIRLRMGDKIFVGKGVSTDTINASAMAYLDSLNNYEFNKKSLNKKKIGSI